jgi:hypothetical protein
VIIITHDYKVVILIRKVIIQHIMKLKLLRNDYNRQVSPMSEGFMMIRVNFKPCKGINLTTRHSWARKAPRVAIVYDAVTESGRVLPQPSVIFHANESADTLLVA